MGFNRLYHNLGMSQYMIMIFLPTYTFLDTALTNISTKTALIITYFNCLIARYLQYSSRYY